MELALLQEWATKLTPFIKGIKGVNGIGISATGISVEVQVVKNSPELRESIESIFEKSGADHVPMSYKLVPKKKSLSAMITETLRSQGV